MDNILGTYYPLANLPAILLGGPARRNKMKAG
jgi:hypothetical protein